MKRGAPVHVFRYAKRLPPRMIAGKVLHRLRSKVMVPRIWAHFERSSGELIPKVGWSGARKRFWGRVLRSTATDSGSRSAFTTNYFASNNVSIQHQSVEEVRSGDRLSDPAMTRWEHDLAYFQFAIPMLRIEEKLGLEKLQRALSQLWNVRRRIPRPREIPVVTNRLGRTDIKPCDCTNPPERCCCSSNPQEVSVVLRHLALCRALLKPLVERYWDTTTPLSRRQVGWLLAWLAVTRLSPIGRRRVVVFLERNPLTMGLVGAFSHLPHAHAPPLFGHRRREDP